jgi:hypothetical protein
MYRVTSTHSKWDWLLRLFMATGERFYPHFMFNWITMRLFSLIE